MPPELLAVVAACCFAGGSCAVKKGARGDSIVGGLLISLATSVVVTGIACVIDSPPMAPIQGLIGFAAAGIFGPAMGRSASMAGVDSLGASVSVPLQGSLYPIAGIASAVLFLGETVSPFQALGVSVVVIGVWLLARGDAKDPTPNPPLLRRGAVPALIFPLVAGIGFGTGDVLRKQAVEVLPSPLFGALIGMASALLVWSVIALSVKRVRGRVIRVGRSWGWFALAGGLSALAVITTISALREGDVSVVTPIVAAQPLPILLLSALFLKEHEKIGWRIVTGALAVVGGTTIVAIAG